MPSKLEILQHLSEVGKGGWVGKGHGAIFRLSRSPSTPPPRIISGSSSVELYLKGKIKGKELLKRDFVEALGHRDYELKTIRGNPLFLFWDTAKILPSQSK